jgi:hypothetical protein
MPTFNHWLIAAQDAADFDAASIIARDPHTLLLARGSTDIAAQTVRIVPQSAARGAEQYGRDGTQTGELVAVIIGDDTLDIARGDRFKWRSATYEVETVNKLLNGQTQAMARGVQK